MPLSKKYMKQKRRRRQNYKKKQFKWQNDCQKIKNCKS